MSESGEVAPMFVLGEPAPAFEVLTVRGTSGPQDFREHWLMVLRCGHWRGADCAVCTARFDALAETLRTRQCHLLVAVDEVDVGTRLPVAGPHASGRSPWTLGRWLQPGVLPAATTEVAVIDPAGVVRAHACSEDSRPLRRDWLITLVDGAQGREFQPVEQHGNAALAYGCVDWYEYDQPGHHTS